MGLLERWKDSGTSAFLQKCPRLFNMVVYEAVYTVLYQIN